MFIKIAFQKKNGGVFCGEKNSQKMSPKKQAIMAFFEEKKLNIKKTQRSFQET